MPRITRIKVKSEPAVYHVVSRTALDGFVLGAVEKDYLLKLIKHFSAIYFAEVLGFCVMGNHLHLLLRMHPGDEYSYEEIRRRFRLCYGDDKKQELMAGQIPHLREKWANLSEYIKEIKQGFSRYYNKLNGRRGYFWSERFTPLNSLRSFRMYYVYVLQSEADHNFYVGFTKDLKLRFDQHQKGSVPSTIARRPLKLIYYEACLNQEDATRREKYLKTYHGKMFLNRTRYFTDSGVIGTQAFVERTYQAFKHHFQSKHEKRPKRIQGLAGVYSLKRLSESV